MSNYVCGLGDSHRAIYCILEVFRAIYSPALAYRCIIVLWSYCRKWAGLMSSSASAYISLWLISRRLISLYSTTRPCPGQDLPAEDGTHNDWFTLQHGCCAGSLDMM